MYSGEDLKIRTTNNDSSNWEFRNYYITSAHIIIKSWSFDKRSTFNRFKIEVAKYFHRERR